MLEWACPLLETCSHHSAPQYPGSLSLFSRTKQTDRKDWLVCLYCHFFCVFLDSHIRACFSQNYPSLTSTVPERQSWVFEPTAAELAHSPQPDICLRGFQTFSCFHLSEFQFCTDGPAPAAQLSYESAPPHKEKKWTKFLCPKFDSWRTHSIIFHHLSLSPNLHTEDIDSPHPPLFLHGWSTFWEVFLVKDIVCSERERDLGMI